MKRPAPINDTDRFEQGLSISLFGQMTVMVNGGHLRPLRSRKGLWLLALLVMRHDRTMNRAWIAETLWPDSSEALRNLRNTLHDLRDALGSEAPRILSPTPGTLKLDLTGCAVDLVAFDSAIRSGSREALQTAVSLYVGPLLTGIDQEWMVADRTRYHQRCLESLDSLAQICMQNGEPEAAARLAQTYIGLEPFEEPARCRLMQALADAGDYAGAAKAYREFRLLLHDQLQMQPATETTALFQLLQLQGRKAATRAAAASLATPVALADALPTQPPLEKKEKEAAKHNLPEAMTSFVGRNHEISEAVALLTRHRLVTLVGSGGAGKTRLALEIVHAIADHGPREAWFIEMAPITDPDLVVQAVANVLGASERSGTAPRDAIVSYLRERDAILIFDNCEHLLSACANLVKQLLNACRNLRILATSRARLGVVGEQLLQISGLALPPYTGYSSGKGSDTLNALSMSSDVTNPEFDRFEAISLFVQRASLVRSNFRLTDENRIAIVRICHRLEGMPLPIELAAGRIRLLSANELADHLDTHLASLKESSSTAPERQRSLRALIDWSYEPLGGAEKLLLMRLSVFRGGFDLMAAEAVTTDSITKSGAYTVASVQVIDALCTLTDNSLIIATERSGRIRYSMLESVREYALERLHASGQFEQLSSRHAAWCLSLALEAEPRLQGGESAGWLDRLSMEHDNLRAALERFGAHTETRLELMQLVGALWRFWLLRGYLTEGRMRIEAALVSGTALPGSTHLAKALYASAQILRVQGNYLLAQTRLTEALAIYAAHNDPAGEAAVLSLMGNTFIDLGDTTAARAALIQSLEKQPTQTETIERADTLGSLAYLLRLLGEYEEARRCLEQAIAITRAHGAAVETASLLGVLANLLSGEGDFEAARLLLEEERDLWRTIGNRVGEAWTLCTLGLLEREREEYALASILVQQALSINRETENWAGEAWNLDSLGDILRESGDLMQSRSLLVTAIDRCETFGNREGKAWASIHLAATEIALNEFSGANSHLQDGARLMHSSANRSGMIEALMTFSDLFASNGAAAEAAPLLGALEFVASNHSPAASPREIRRLHRITDKIRTALTPELFSTLKQNGSHLSIEEALKRCL